MADYLHTTRECAFDDLHAEIRRVILSLAEQHGLAEIPGQIALCAETMSNRRQKGRLVSFFASPVGAAYTTGIVATPHWLVWVKWEENQGTAAALARLNEVEVRAYQPPLLQLQDSGLEIVGRINDAVDPVTAFIGLGEDEAAGDFANRLIAWAAGQRE